MPWRAEEIACLALLLFAAVVLPCCIIGWKLCNPECKYNPATWRCACRRGRVCSSASCRELV